jgi:hypothetical protein
MYVFIFFSPYGNTVFYLRLFYLRPIFLGTNLGRKTRPMLYLELEPERVTE